MSRQDTDRVSMPFVVRVCFTILMLGSLMSTALARAAERSPTMTIGTQEVGLTAGYLLPHRLTNDHSTKQQGPAFMPSWMMTLTDPALFRCPFVMMTEVGSAYFTEAEAAGLRDYVLKGGFVIFDDFIGPRHWANFEEQIRRVFPENRLVQLTDASHPIFDSFFRIESLDFRDPNRGIPSEFWGMFEDNDPSRRLLFIANYNNDIGDYWEWSDQGFLPIELSNEAYKLGANYVIYAMTH